MRSEDEMVAYALEIQLSLLPYLPELLADLDELGSDAQAITCILDSLNPRESTTVVDLGCGKGAVAVEVAANLNLNVLGIELFEPFLESCRALARTRGVSELCRFVHGDISKLAGSIDPCDIAIFAALGDVLGPLDQTVSIIRKYVKPGGYIVISDGFIKDGGSSDFPGFERYSGHDDMIARVTACGDTLVSEVIGAVAFDRGEEELIAARANAIAARRPEIAAEVLSYAEMQAAEYDYLDGHFDSAIWVLKRSL